MKNLNKNLNRISNFRQMNFLGVCEKMVQLVAILVCSGREFHDDGPQAEKARSANLRAVRGTASLVPLLDRRSILGLYD